MRMLKTVFCMFVISFLVGCSSKEYSYVSVPSLIDDIISCLSDSCIGYEQKLGKNKEFDSHKRLRYTELDGNEISVYWEPYQYDSAGILAVRIQNKDGDKWYVANATEIGFFKAVAIQVYGNTFSNTVLGPVMGFFAH